jgi:hypothetical protein
MRFIKSSYKISIIIILLCCAQPGWTMNKTNLQIIEQAYASIWREFCDAVTIGDSSHVNVTSEVQHDYNWVIEKQLYQCLSQRNVENIYSNNQDESAFRVVYNPVLQKIAYDKFDKKRAKRQVNIQLFARILDPQNKILVAETITRTSVDTILTKQVKNVENAGLPFTVGEQKKTWLAGLYEPMIVTIITGMVIFLFYSFRSQ